MSPREGVLSDRSIKFMNPEYFPLDLGTQIDIESREAAENVVQFQGELGRQFQEAGLVPSVSPGRKVFQEFGLYNLYGC